MAGKTGIQLNPEILKLRNKVILITGASAGIGAVTAQLFDREGAMVAMASRRREKLDELALKMNHPLVIPVDMSDEEQARKMVQQVVSHFGHIDVLVNNAASIIVSRSDTVSSTDLMKAFMTNLVGPVAATQEAIGHMRKRGGGQIINVGSPGFMMGIPFYAPYVCSKAAFSAWTRTIQAEWAGTEIVVCEYFPGYVKTDSPPDSRLGEVNQDFLMKSEQNIFTRLFAKPKTPDHVAGQLVKLVLKPKTLTYSDFSVKIGSYISNISSFRLSIARQMAATAREKKKLSIFAE